MDTNAIISAVMQQLVDTVADAVICRLKAEGAAQAALDIDSINMALSSLLSSDSAARDAVRDIVSDSIDNFDLNQLSEFQDLQRDVERLSEKVEELDPAVIDADNTDFDAAVMQVLRNNI